MGTFAELSRTNETRAPKGRPPQAPLYVATPPAAHGGRAAPGTQCACGGGCPRCREGARPPHLQTKLEVSTPGDPFEREADRIAEQVMGTTQAVAASRTPVAAPRSAPTLQRACAACEEEEEGILQRKETAGAAPRVAPEVGGPIDALRGGGEPLPARVRAFFEPRFNYDFGAVRTHAGPGAAAAARALNARAFTVGSDIAFASGQYHPDAPEGRRLLAHELAHVVQQGGGKEPLRLARMTEEEQQDNPESSKPDQLATTGPAVNAGCPADAKAFEVTNETTFANPKFEPDFEDEGQRPALSTRATSAPFRWNASVKLKGKAQGCFEVGFLQTLRSSFQAAVYDAQTGTREKMCLVLTPNPVRDAKEGVREPWYMEPMRLGTGCFPGLVLPPGIGSDVDQTTAQMDDNPFLRWCVFVSADEQKTGTNCGPSNAAFRLNTLVETLAFDAWLVVRPVGSTDTNCFTFLRHATWVKSVEIVLGKTGSIGFLRRDLGVKLVELGDGIGPEKPSFGSDTAGSTSERVCI